ncbi:MAG: DUF2490 domain-containing protein [Bacteroidetes bacterium]|nr:DUF2490 domain-containing protein [Bacteroidota bacterium]MDA1122444.1 DUF2490 domain-containing protein [Bacteroidota bacterium]
MKPLHRSLKLISNVFWIILMVLALSLPLAAQNDDTGNWIMYFGLNRVSNKFSIHSEVQYRNHTLSPSNIEQLLLRTGLNYHFTDKAFLSTGYAYIANHQFESEQTKPESREHRIWQQFILTNNIGRVKFEHRYRIEQRWADNDYRGRFRYRLMLFVPFNKPKIEKGTVFLGLYDEIFVNPKQVFFDRNRLYGALGYQVDKTVGVQMGMLYQQVNDNSKWYFQLALLFNPDFRKTEKS